MHIKYLTSMVTSQQNNSSPGGQEIYNFGRSFRSHYNHILGFFFYLWMKCRKEYVEINARMIHLHDSSWNLQSYFSLKCNAKNNFSKSWRYHVKTHVPWDMPLGWRSTIHSNTSTKWLKWPGYNNCVSTYMASISAK